MMRQIGSLDFLWKEIDKLVEAGWEVIDTNYDRAAFLDWRKKVAIIRTLLKDENL